MQVLLAFKDLAIFKKTRFWVPIIITKTIGERERCCSKKSLSYCSTTDTYICYCTTYIFPFIDQLLLLILELQYCHFYEACIVKLQISLWVFDQRPKQTKPYNNSAYVIIYVERQQVAAFFKKYVKYVMYVLIHYFLNRLKNMYCKS